MADNFAFTPGSGATGAADDVDGVLYPRVKLDWGTDGTANDVDTAAGKALPVQLRDTSGNEIGTSAHPVRTDPTGTTTQPVSVASLPLPSGAATESTLAGIVTTTDFDTKVGSVTETAPATDTASSGLNGRLQRIAQRLTALIALLPAALTGSGNFKVALVESTVTQPVSGSVTANIGTSGSLALDATLTGGTQRTKMTDGTNNAAVKAASTAAVATDPALVVAVSPNNTVPVSLASVPTHAVTQSGTWTQTPVPATSGGLSVSRIAAAASTNANSVKASAGQVYGWVLINNTSSAKFFKLYNKASSPTVGTDTPFATIIIPASGGTNVEFSMGIPLGTGIAYAITGAVADSDTTALAANDVHGLLLYK